MNIKQIIKTNSLTVAIKKRPDNSTLLNTIQLNQSLQQKNYYTQTVPQKEKFNNLT